MPTNQRTFSFNYFFRRSEELSGQWVAHCLDLDVVTYGNSLQQALDLVQDAVNEVVIDDLSAGLEPTQRSAPREDWEAMLRMVRGAGTKAYPLSEVLRRESEVRFVMVQLVAAFHQIDHTSHLHGLGAPEHFLAQAA